MWSKEASIRNQAHAERLREERTAGLMSERFPGVSSIVVTLNYKGGRSSSLLRTVNFFPGNPAYFRINCLGEGCERGALDLTWVIGSMIRRGERSSRGEVRCVNHTPETRHADVDYSVAITCA